MTSHRVGWSNLVNLVQLELYTLAPTVVLSCSFEKRLELSKTVSLKELRWLTCLCERKVLASIFVCFSKIKSDGCGFCNCTMQQLLFGAVENVPGVSRCFIVICLLWSREKGPSIKYPPTPNFCFNFLQRSKVYSKKRPSNWPRTESQHDARLVCSYTQNDVVGASMSESHTSESKWDILTESVDYVWIFLILFFLRPLISKMIFQKRFK